MTIAEALDFGRKELSENGISEAAREASSLLAFAAGRDRSFLIAHPEYVLSADEATVFASTIERRANREPFQYIVGKQEFYGLEFSVSPAALIPRPETEMLVEHSIYELAKLDHPRFLEIGIGTGCISVSILMNVPDARCVAVDISEPALSLADENVRRQGVEERIELRSSNVYEEVTGTFDLIVSNPPYVPADDIQGLQPEVRDHEPHTALTDGADGLSVICAIIEGAPAHLDPGGRLLIEIGLGESTAVAAMLDRAIWRSFQFNDDLQGIPRVLSAHLA